MTVKKPKANKKHWRGAPSPDGLSHKKKETVRRCLVTRETLPMNRLIRFCVSPERMVVPDLANKLPGRGMWVTADRDLVETACGKGLFAKAAHAKVTYPEDMDGLIKSLFVKRLQSLLGLAKKAGLVVSGFEKTAELLKKKTGCLPAGSNGRGGRRTGKAGSSARRYSFDSDIDCRSDGRSFGRRNVCSYGVETRRGGRFICCRSTAFCGILQN